jgi:hypothetical protein
MGHQRAAVIGIVKEWRPPSSGTASVFTFSIHEEDSYPP